VQRSLYRHGVPPACPWRWPGALRRPLHRRRIRRRKVPRLVPYSIWPRRNCRTSASPRSTCSTARRWAQNRSARSWRAVAVAAAVAADAAVAAQAAAVAAVARVVAAAQAVALRVAAEAAARQAAVPVVAVAAAAGVALASWPAQAAAVAAACRGEPATSAAKRVGCAELGSIHRGRPPERSAAPMCEPDTQYRDPRVGPVPGA
jgi:hypothetical protein